jgi:hypothetical protein
MRASSRRGLCAALAAVTWASGAAWADDVPANLQARLLASISGHVYTLPQESPLRVMVVYPVSATAGSRDAQTLAAAIAAAQADKFKTTLVPFKSTADLKDQVRTQRPAIVYLAADLDEAGIRGAVDACDQDGLLTVAEASASVQFGVILGFALFEGKPRLVVNLPRVQRQRVRLSSSLLSLAQIIK